MHSGRINMRVTTREIFRTPGIPRTLRKSVGFLNLDSHKLYPKIDRSLAVFGDYKDSETGIEYMMLEDGTYIGEQTPLVVCSQCEHHYARDSERDLFGYYAPPPKDYSLVGDEDEDKGPLCKHCLEQNLTDALDEQTLDLLERKLGLNEGNYAALNSVLRLVEDPDKLVQIVQVHSRVDELERRLEDRVDNLRSEVSSFRNEISGKLIVYSIALSIVLALAGFLAGLLV